MIHARDDYNRIQDPEGKIGEDEPVILFRAQDKHFATVLRLYHALIATDQDCPDAARILHALNQQTVRAHEWRKTHRTKAPDL